MKVSEELLYLLNFMDYNIEEFIYLVIDDSEKDPHYSAVTANNLIKCLIRVMQEFNIDCPYQDVKSYFERSHISIEEYNIFEGKRLKESKYYIGKQF